MGSLTEDEIRELASQVRAAHEKAMGDPWKAIVMDLLSTGRLQ